MRTFRLAFIIHVKRDDRSYLIFHTNSGSRNMLNAMRYVLYAQIKERFSFCRRSGDSSDYTARRISHFVFVQVAGTGSYLFHLRAGLTARERMRGSSEEEKKRRPLRPSPGRDRIERSGREPRTEESWRRVVPLLFVLPNILIGRRPRRVIYRLTMLGRLAINYVVLRYFI